MEQLGLKSIELCNYRQFKAVKIDFSLDRTKPFTIIEGRTGFGKSNILNALSWCFYGVEEHLDDVKTDEVEPMINTKEISRLKDEERISARVTVMLSSNRGDIKIEREISGKKRGEKFYTDDKSHIKILIQDSRGNYIPHNNPTYLVNQILPQVVMPFFFFDGEQLRQFFEKISPDDVKEAIFNISQISLIELAISHLNKVLNDYRSVDVSDDPRLKDLKTDIDFYNRNIEEIPKQIKDLEMENKDADKNIELIDSELRSSNIEVIKQLQEQRDIRQAQYGSYSDDLEDAEGELNTYLINNVPMLLSKEAISSTLKVFDELSMAGILPPKIEDTFIRELLDVKKECICGTDLSSGKARETLLKRITERKIKEGVANEANELKYTLKHLFSQTANFDEMTRTLNLKIINLKGKLTEAKESLSEINTKLEKYKGLGKEDIVNKERERKAYQQARDENISKIASLKINLDDCKKKLKLAANQHDTISKNIGKNKKILQKKEFIKAGINVLEDVQQKLISELRVEIEKNTKEFFKKVVSSKTLSDLLIDENYKIQVLKETNYNALKSLSVGETLLLGLSFMAALRKVSGFVAPVVIDTPLAPLDNEYRDNLIDFLTMALNDTQIILLVKNSEYTPNVKSKLDGKVGVEKLLKHDKTTGLTEVVNYA